MEEQFFDLILNGSLQEIQEFYNNNPSINISDYVYAFCSACGYGRLEVAKWLLEVKPDIDISADDENAFCCVCAHGHLHAAKWLLEIKPDIVISNMAFFNACRYKNIDIALWLSKLEPRFVVVIKDDVILDYCVI